jgi:hypothetical protein
MQFAYFKDRTRKWLELAKRLHSSQLAQTFRDRARLLTRNRPSPGVVLSQAKTLDDLKRELQKLPDTNSLCLPVMEYSPDKRHELWCASPHLSQEFGCSAELRPDGCLWFVKRG